MSCEESTIIAYITSHLPLILMISVQVQYIERLCDFVQYGEYATVHDTKSVPQWSKSNLPILSTLKSILYIAQVILDRNSSYEAHIRSKIPCSTHYTASKKIREVTTSDSWPKHTKNLHVQLAYTTLCVREVRLQYIERLFAPHSFTSSCMCVCYRASICCWMS